MTNACAPGRGAADGAGFDVRIAAADDGGLFSAPARIGVAAEIVRQVPAETLFQAHAGSGFDVSEAHGVAGDQVVPPARPDCPFGEPLVLAFDGELDRRLVVPLVVPAEEAVATVNAVPQVLRFSGQRPEIGHAAGGAREG